MNPQHVNQITAVIAMVLIVIVFVLVAGGVINGLVAIILTLGIGAGTQYARKALIKG